MHSELVASSRVCECRSTRWYHRAVSDWRARPLAIVGAALLLGCSPLPEADSEGRRVRVGSDVVEQICGGTLTRLDSEIETIEDRLALPHDRDRVDVFIVSDDVFEHHCGDEAHGCFQGPADRVILRDGTFEQSVTHELTHAVAWRQPAGWAPRFFAEGLAVALAPPYCEIPDLDPQTHMDEMLASGTAYDHGRERNYVAGQLVAWLLATHGPVEVLAFMGALRQGQKSDSIRKVYFDWFGTTLDHDIGAHERGEPLTAREFGYLAPPVGPEAEVAAFSLTAELDCDSPRVHNDFEQPARGWVEWTLDLQDPSHGGRYTVIGDIPEGTRLEYQWATCIDPDEPGGEWREFDEENVAYLHPERIQRVRWTGPLGSEPLNVELLGPCDPDRQNCPDGLVCSEGGDCRPLGDSPAGLGEACEEDDDTGPLACAQGLVCIGDDVVDGSPEGSCLAGCAFADKSCPLGTTCDPEWEFCARGCDPLAQDCDAGEVCFPSGDDGICVPSKNRGMLEACRMENWDSGFACAPGLVCQRFSECDSDDPSLGCCVPLCHPAESSCPSDLPQCTALSFTDLGACRP